MAVDDETVERLAEHVVPLERSAPGGGSADLGPLADALGDERVVGLGEATHGTREFFQLKHRIVRLLVAELGFRLFGLEANFPEARAVDRYVVSGDGDPEDALGELGYWTWNTEEMLALVEWLRAYNAGRPATEKVRFYGYDVQSARGHARAIRRFLERVDPDAGDDLAGDLATLEAGRPGDDPEATKEWLVAAETVATTLETLFGRRGDAYRSETSDREWRLVRRHRRFVEQVRDLEAAKAFDGADAPNGVRDAAMAENVSWILDHESVDRIVLWAHNGHVSKGTFGPGDRETGPETMGHHLRGEFGDDYYALGFEFARGSFRARPDPETVDDPRVREFSLESVPEGSASAALDGVGDQLFYLDVRTATDDRSVREWLGRELRLHNVGAVFFDDERDYASTDLATEFDGVVFVAETTGTVPVDGGETQ